MPDESIFINVGEGSNTKRRQKKEVALPLKFTLGILGLVLLLFGGGVYGLWRLAENATHRQITVIAILFFFLIPITFFLGHWFGRTEVRGFLSGMDTAVDRIAKAVDLRDGAKVSLHQRIQAPQQPPQSRIYPPPVELPTQSLPQLTFRESSSDQIIDL
ncbi:MAG: hypothetical protein H8D34_33095 [Chloroflexi bacterium]|nr:hypothetical protein [Chloroflexota bacterium]